MEITKNDFDFILYILYIPVKLKVLFFLFDSGFAGLGYIRDYRIQSVAECVSPNQWQQPPLPGPWPPPFP